MWRIFSRAAASGRFPPSYPTLSPMTSRPPIPFYGSLGRNGWSWMWARFFGKFENPSASS